MKAHLLRSEPKKCLFYVWVLILAAWSRVFFESFVRGDVEISIVIKMQQVQFETSMKNIPLGGKKEYVMQLTK